MTADLKELSVVWAEDEKIAGDWEKWRTKVLMAMCPIRDDEDEWVRELVSVAERKPHKN